MAEDEVEDNTAEGEGEGQSEATETQATFDLKTFLASMNLSTEQEAPPTPMIQDDFSTVNIDVSEEDRFVSTLAALLFNVESQATTGHFDKAGVFKLIEKIDHIVNEQVNAIIHNEKFMEMESMWRSMNDLVLNTKFKQNVMLDLFDADKKELFEDFENNAVDITGAALFRKIYVAEYDSYGGRPFGAMMGLYAFTHTPKDEAWLRVMGKIAAASHTPFVSTVSPEFFGCQNIEELAAIKDLEALMNHPKYGSWNTLRETEEAAYIGLTLPRYIARLPYHPVTNPDDSLNFTELANGDGDADFLWGASTILFAKNMVRSFVQSGWVQYLRGPKGGGLISGLPVYTFNIRGEEEIKVPVEMVIPDYREYEFARVGFIPLVYRKGTADACFFSCQSIKKAKAFQDPKDSENAQLVTNLSYTLSITRIAHYIKSIMRDNIGSSADAPYIQRVLDTWLFKYVTTAVNPDDLTLRFYPFKAAEVKVTPKEGMIGWYDCEISILPHIQFEGMDVELRLETRLG